MKVLAAISALAVGLCAILAYQAMQQSQLLSTQADDYARQVTQLLTQIENNSLNNIQTDKEISSLQSELSSRDGQIAALSRQLELARQQTDPDYERVEAQIRQQVRREIQPSNRIEYSNPRSSLVQRLAELDPTETSEILSLSAQYGDFFNSLTISDERMDAVITAFANMLASRNQQRVKLVEEMRTDPTAVSRSEFQERMAEIFQPGAEIAALSYELTESELNAFRAYQEQRRTDYTPFLSTSSGTMINTSDGTTSSVNFFNTELIESNSDQRPRSIQILPAEPIN